MQDDYVTGAGERSTTVWKVDPRRWARRILVGILVLQALAAVGDYVLNYVDLFDSLPIRRIFNIAREESFPTWVATTQEAGLAITGFLLAWTSPRRPRMERWGWYLVAFFFFYVSIDDAAQVHERVGSALADAVAEGSFLADWPSFSWQIFLGPVLAGGLLATAVVIWVRIPARSTRILVVLALVGFAIAQFFDFLEGIEDLFSGWAVDLGVDDYTVSHGFRSTEEMFEMLATTALWAPMLWHFAGRLAGTSVDFPEDVVVPDAAGGG